MKKLKKSLALLAFAFLSIISFNACCKHASYAMLQIHFQTDNYSGLDSVLVITTNAHGQELETNYWDLSKSNTILLPMHPGQTEHPNYTIKNNEPHFEFIVTDIIAERVHQKTCSKIEYSFKFNGTQYPKKSSHEITVKP